MYTTHNNALMCMQIRDSGAVHLCALIRDNNVLTSLNVTDNPVGEKGKRSMLAACKTKCAGSARWDAHMFMYI
jgi:hypothetical protein